MIDSFFDNFWAWAIGLLLAIVIFGGIGCANYSKVHTVTIHVTGKESVSTDNGHEYRIYAEEDTYVMTDSIVHPRFNTANLYGKFAVPLPGQPAIPYRCRVYGWRVGLFSSFKNILSCQRLPVTR